MLQKVELRRWLPRLLIDAPEYPVPVLIPDLEILTKHPKNWETALWGKERLY